VRDLAPKVESMAGIGIHATALTFHSWRDQPAGRDPNNSRSNLCTIGRVVADRVMGLVDRVEYDRASCTGNANASWPAFLSM
jgi:hypothetical protein